VWHELHQILTQLRSLSQALQTIHLAQSSHTISHPPSSHAIIAYYISPARPHTQSSHTISHPPSSHAIIAYYISPARPHTQSSHTISHPPSHAIIAYYLSPTLSIAKLFLHAGALGNVRNDVWLYSERSEIGESDFVFVPFTNAYTSFWYPLCFPLCTVLLINPISISTLMVSQCDL